MKRKQIDLKTPEGRRKFYKSSECQVLRRIKLTNNPWCEKCLKENHNNILAENVHHIIDIKNDPTGAIEYNNLMSLCKSCHSSINYDENKGSFSKPKLFDVVNKKWNIEEMRNSVNISVDI